jgi:hypothetical protein
LRWAAALPSGKRQIFSFHIPGDIPDLQTLHLQVMDHNVGTLVLSKVAFISQETVRAFLRAHLRIADVFWRDTLIDAAIYREWMAGIGRRDAHARPLGQLLHFRLRSAPITPRPAPMIGHLARPSFSSSRLTCRGRGGKASPTGSTSAAGR